jgi:hypothetical protein
VPVKSSCRGVAWKGAWTGVGDRNVEPDGIGGRLHDGLDTIGRVGVGGAGDTTIGGSCMGTLGRPVALGFVVGGRREVRGAAMTRRCLEGW